MNASPKAEQRIIRGLTKPMAAAWQASEHAPAFAAARALSAEQLAAAWAHLQQWVQPRRTELPPLSRLGAMAGLTRAQATVLLTGAGNRTARTAERFTILTLILKKYGYLPATHA